MVTTCVYVMYLVGRKSVICNLKFHLKIHLGAARKLIGPRTWKTTICTYMYVIPTIYLSITSVASHTHFCIRTKPLINSCRYPWSQHMYSTICNASEWSQPFFFLNLTLQPWVYQGLYVVCSYGTGGKRILCANLLQKVAKTLAITPAFLMQFYRHRCKLTFSAYWPKAPKLCINLYQAPTTNFK
jgi:hypothetical protein